jgi:hypothetical protein
MPRCSALRSLPQAQGSLFTTPQVDSMVDNFSGLTCLNRDCIVAMRDIVLSSGPHKGYAAHSHGFQPYQSKWLNAAVRQHGISDME